MFVIEKNTKILSCIVIHNKILIYEIDLYMSPKTH